MLRRSGGFQPMTEPEALSRICEHLEFIFPDQSDGPYWGQEPYRSDLFQIFAASHGSCHLHGDRIWQYLQDQWFPRKNVSDDDRQAISDICRAWSEWRYAWDKLPQ